VVGLTNAVDDGGGVDERGAADRCLREACAGRGRQSEGDDDSLGHESSSNVV
jgi:hypothetical protein